MKAKLLNIGSWIVNIGPFAKKPMEWWDFVNLVKKLGFDGISPGGFGKHLAVDTYSMPAAQAELKKRYEDTGLAWDLMAADLWGFPYFNGGTLDAGVRTQFVDRYKASADLCAAVGIPGIRMDSVHAPAQIPDDKKAAFVDALVAVVIECANYGATLGLKTSVEMEPCWEGINRIAKARAFYDRVIGGGHAQLKELFGLMYDYTHVAAILKAEGKPHDQHGGAIMELTGCINAIHIGDNKDGESHEGNEEHPPTGRHLPLGDGNLPLEEISGALDSEPNAGDSRTLDLCFHDGTYPQEFEKSLAVMQKIWPRG